MAGIHFLVTNLGVGWVRSHQLDLVRALLFVRGSVPRDLAVSAVELANDCLEAVITRCNDFVASPLPDADLVPMDSLLGGDGDGDGEGEGDDTAAKLASEPASSSARQKAVEAARAELSSRELTARNQSGASLRDAFVVHVQDLVELLLGEIASPEEGVRVAVQSALELLASLAAGLSELVRLGSFFGGWGVGCGGIGWTG